MKGCLAVLGFVVVGAALLVGVVIVVTRGGAEKNEPLTAQTSAVEFTSYEPETRGRAESRVPGANVEYRYEADGRSYASGDPIWLPAGRLLDKVVCFDPDDPAEHVLRGNPRATCGEGDLGDVRRAEAVAP